MLQRSCVDPTCPIRRWMDSIPKPRNKIPCRHRMQTRIRMALVADRGAASLQGTSRKQNEDRFTFREEDGDKGGVSFAAVFDGHGGYACADWLATNFAAYVDKYWREYGADAPEVAMTEAFLAADKKILSPKPGLFGMMGERGIGGSKCGATGAIAVLFKDKKTGNQRLLAANAGDARILLGRGGKPRQLSVDHVPDSEEERIRIEAQNPNPKQPLVRYVGGTWRVGGLLALSRAFGDAYLKGTGQFEGVAAGSDGYSSGFGVIADPDVMTIDLGASQDDKTLSKNNQNHSWLIVSSDGLFANVERGGGGGLTNEQVISTCDQMFAKGSSCFEIAEALAEGAVEAGSTDDVTVLVLRLQA